MKIIINPIATGAEIKSWMNTKGYSIADLATIMNITYMSVYKWTKGYSLPTIDNFVFLSALFDVKIDDLLITEECEQ